MNETATSTAPRWECKILARDTGMLVIVAAILAFGSNAVRADRLPLIATKDFETLVPCPEPLGTAGAIASDDPRIRVPTTLVIDARSQDEYATWHVLGAINVPFDWLAEQEQITKQTQQIARDVARSKKHVVVVYGDGGDPDSGREWAALLNSAGIRNVVFVTGGAAALRGPLPSPGSTHSSAPITAGAEHPITGLNPAAASSTNSSPSEPQP